MIQMQQSITIEGVPVLTGLGNLAKACNFLFGLTYARNLQYPSKYAKSFEVFQRLFLGLKRYAQNQAAGTQTSRTSFLFNQHFFNAVLYWNDGFTIVLALCFDVIHSSWKCETEWVIKSLFKKSTLDALVIDSYRPISNQPFVGKKTKMAITLMLYSLDLGKTTALRIHLSQCWMPFMWAVTYPEFQSLYYWILVLRLIQLTITYCLTDLKNGWKFLAPHYIGLNHTC